MDFSDMIENVFGGLVLVSGIWFSIGYIHTGRVQTEKYLNYLKNPITIEGRVIAETHPAFLTQYRFSIKTRERIYTFRSDAPLDSLIDPDFQVKIKPDYDININQDTGLIRDESYTGSDNIISIIDKNGSKIR